MRSDAITHTWGYLGVDVGGTGAKAGVFDASGRRLGAGQAGFTAETTDEGFAEVPVETIYEAARKAARSALRESGVRVRAMSVVTQGQTFVTLDEDDHPLHPAIIWYDSRAAEQAAQLAAAIASAAPSGPLPLVQSISSAPKILWLRARRPDVMARAHRHLLLPDYFAYRLSGKAVTDPVTAATTGLYAYGSPGYCVTALDAAGIGSASLAAIQEPGTPIGTLLPAMADEWEVNPDVLLITGTNDQFAGALGAGNSRPGIVSATAGTCLALVTVVPALPDPLPAGLFGGPFVIPGAAYMLAYAKTAGLVLDWLRAQVCPHLSLRELDAMAMTVPVGSNGLTASPHFDGMISPRALTHARGFLANLTLGHTLADLYRALLESLAYSVRENLGLLRDAGGDTQLVRAIGGGAVSDVWLQMVADVSGVPIERPAVTEAAALGAAMLAAVGMGEYASLAESAAALYRADRIFMPDADTCAAYEPLYRRYRELCDRMYRSADE